MFAPQRSQSGPGLSINTGAANLSGTPASGGLFGAKPAGSLFGSTTTTAPSAGTLFGATTTSAGGSSLFGTTASAPSQAGTLFGGSATATQPAASGGLFGNTGAASKPGLFGNTGTTTAPATGSLFGATPAQPAQQSTSLFGNTAAQPQQQTSSLFGNASAQPQQTTSLFGNTTTQPAQTGSLFGGTPSQPQQSTSLFGASTAQAQPSGSLFGGATQTGGGLFGNSTAQPQQQTMFNQSQGNQGKSLFGASQNTQGGLQHSTLNPAQRTQRPLFSTSIGAYTAEQQAIPGVRINLNELRPTTRFNDLHEAVQKEIEQIDTSILNQIKLAEEAEGLMPQTASLSVSIPPDVDICEQKLEALQRSLEADAVAIDDAKKLVKKDADAARLSFKAISALRMPAHLQAGASFRATTATPTIPGAAYDSETTGDLLSYFSTQTDEMSKKLEAMKKQLAEVESYLSSTESQQLAQIQSTRLSHGRDGGVKSAEDQIKEMAGALQAFEGGILGVASRITATRESLGALVVGDPTARRQR